MQHLDLLDLDAVRAGEGTPEQSAHVLACPECRAAVDHFRDLATRLSPGKVVIPDSITRAILRPRRSWRPALAAAAVLLAAVGLWMLPRPVDIVDAYAAASPEEARAIARRVVSLPQREPFLAFVATQESRFAALDVYVTTGEQPLAAWQLEVQFDPSRSKIISIEGGEPAAFAEPPFYDPAALQANRIVLAAFTTAPNPPAGRVRVARLHLQESGAADYVSKLIATAAPGGKRFDGKIELVRLGGSK